MRIPYEDGAERGNREISRFGTSGSTRRSRGKLPPMADTHRDAGDRGRRADRSARRVSGLDAPTDPVVRLLGPAGWLLDESADSLAVVRTPEEVDGFWVNAIISHDRVPRAVDFEAAAKTTWARIKQSSPDATPTLEKMARFGNNVVYLRGVELKAPEVGTQSRSAPCAVLRARRR